MTTAPIPPRIGRYEVVRRLGSGGMGDVYLAEDPHIGRRLALKTVRFGALPEDELESHKQRLLREARAAGRLLHPNIVTLFDAGELEGALYLAFEYVKGEDLSQRLRRSEELPLAEVLRLVREVAGALGEAHRHGIVHRDVKPANVLLAADGRAKVTDFGIAKVVGQSTHLTQTGSVIGSPQYMSPEQVRGEALDDRSDLFSLGVVLYEMLTRSRPFNGEHVTTLVYQILSEEPPPVEQLRPGLPPRLSALVKRMLAKDPGLRAASADEVIAEVAAIEAELGTGAADDGSYSPTRPLAAPPVPPPPPPLPAAVPSGTYTSRRVPAGLAAAGLLVFVAVLAAGWWLSRVRNPGPPSEPAVAELAPPPASLPEVAPPPPPSTLKKAFPTPASPIEESTPPPSQSAPPSGPAAEGSIRPSPPPPSMPSPSKAPPRSPPPPPPPVEPPPPPPPPVQPPPSPEVAPPPTVPPPVRTLPVEPAPPPPEPPEPEPHLARYLADARLARSEVDTGLALLLEVEPADAVVKVWRRGDRRGIVQGQAADFEPKRRQKNVHTLDLPFEGEYLLYLSREGSEDYVIKLHASAARSGEPTVIRATLR